MLVFYSYMIADSFHNKLIILRSTYDLSQWLHLRSNYSIQGFWFCPSIKEVLYS